MIIRPARSSDDQAIWSMIQPVIRSGETYALPRDMSEQEAVSYWTGTDRQTFIAEQDGEVLGTYYLRPNQLGGGRHVANCGYVTAANATGKGVAATMCEHSQTTARAAGFTAMQFNLVVSTNTRAVALWQRLGFAIVGTLPGAYAHPQFGHVDAHIMFKTLI